MFRETESKDIKSILAIYNATTKRNRTEDQHSWEWFESPDKNYSYVITDKEDEVLGHHGILAIALNKADKQYRVGKTENTVIKEGYGPIYFKHERLMNKEYKPKFDVLVTTTAKGVTRRIREKLKYNVFGNYSIYFRPLSPLAAKKYFTNKFLLKLISLFSFYFPLKSLKVGYNVNEVSLIEGISECETFYNNIKGSLGVSQVRKADYLKYRFIDNPYKKSRVIVLKNSNQTTKGVLAYYIEKSTAYIEDVLVEDQECLNQLVLGLAKIVKKERSASVLFLKLLNNSFLDKYNFKGFLKINNKDDFFMISNNNEELELNLHNFYFTPLFMEGIV